MYENTLQERVNELTLSYSTITAKIASPNPGFIDDVLDAIRRVLETVLNKIGDGLRGVIDDIAKALEKQVGKVTDLIDAFTDTVENIVGGILERVGTFFDSIVATLESAISAIVASLTDITRQFRESLDGIIDTILYAFTDTLYQIAEWIDNLVETIKRILIEFGGKVRELAETMWSGIQELSRRVAETIEDAARTMVEKIRAWLQSLIERLVNAIEALLERAFEIYTDIVLPAVGFVKDVKDKTWKSLLVRRDGIAELMAGTYGQNIAMVQSGIEKLTHIEEFTDLTSMFIAFAFVVSVLPSIFNSYAMPVLALAAQKANSNLPTSLLSPDVMVREVYRGHLYTDEYVAEMAKAGYTALKAHMYLEAGRPLPSPGAIQDAYLRGFIDERKHDSLLQKHGYTPEDVALFKALYRVIPTPPDLIRMAVREAFTPEIAERFGQYEDLPTAFVEWAEKQGLSKEWAERYWAAHWDLPSATMGFEMLHRGIIDKEELKLLLRALDVMPFWREKLIHLSYAPYTRVDVRRMYQVGILDYEGVKRAYQDLGYDETKATALADFTVKYYTEEDKTELDDYRELTRNVYITAYKKNVISREEAKDYLKAIGYREEDAELLLAIADAETYVSDTREDILPKRAQTQRLILDAYKRGLYNRFEAQGALSSLLYDDDEIEYYLSLSDYELELSVKSEYLETVRELYVTRTIDKAEALAWLGKLFITSRETDTLFDLWNIAREMRTRKPTEAQLRYAMQRGLITKQEYEDELRGLGYAEKYVRLLSAMASTK